MALFQALREQADISTQRTSRLRLAPSSAAQQSIDTGRYGEYMAHFRGALLQLFGEPYTVDSDADYIYFVEARDGAATRWILKVMAGASGPSIRGDASDTRLIAIAEELRTLIEATQPADFEATYKGSDSPKQVVYGCRNGVCYWREAE